MKILVRRWIDINSGTITAASDAYKGGPVANQWSGGASRAGAKSVIVFSKAENLYSHNTELSAKKINSILKLSKVTALKEGDTILINIL